MEALRKQLVDLLKGGQAYESFDDIVAEFPPNIRGVIPNGAEHSPWQILDHMHLALRDQLDYIQNENGTYQEKDWPGDYWSKFPAPPEPNGWQETIDTFKSELAELESLAQAKDLYTLFAWAPDHNLLRQLLLSADHNAYHLGELVMLRRMFP